MWVSSNSFALQLFQIRLLSNPRKFTDCFMSYFIYHVYIFITFILNYNHVLLEISFILSESLKQNVFKVLYKPTAKFVNHIRRVNRLSMIRNSYILCPCGVCFTWFITANIIYVSHALWLLLYSVLFYAFNIYDAVRQKSVYLFVTTYLYIIC